MSPRPVSYALLCNFNSISLYIYVMHIPERAGYFFNQFIFFKALFRYKKFDILPSTVTMVTKKNKSRTVRRCRNMILPHIPSRARRNIVTVKNYTHDTWPTGTNRFDKCVIINNDAIYNYVHNYYYHDVYLQYKSVWTKFHYRRIYILYKFSWWLVNFDV